MTLFIKVKLRLKRFGFIKPSSGLYENKLLLEQQFSLYIIYIYIYIYIFLVMIILIYIYIYIYIYFFFS